MNDLSYKWKLIRRAIRTKLTSLVPRCRRKWVFGGMGNDNNSAYLFIWLNSNPRHGIRPMWIGDRETVNLMRRRGFRAHTRHGLPGIWHTLTSKVWIYTSYVSDIHELNYGGVFKVNLWHGVGIKSIESKITTGPYAEVYHPADRWKRMAGQWRFVRPDLMLSTSPMMTEHFSECFRIAPEKCFEARYPRCEILYMSENDASDFVDSYCGPATRELYHNLDRYSTVYFYLPTWRDTGDDFLASSGIDFDEIDRIMAEKNAVFLFKPHINTRLPERLRDNSYSNVLILDRAAELNPILRRADVLVTDYSSVYYDYLLRPDGRTIFFLPDYEQYMKADRDLAYPFDENTAGTKVYSYADFRQLLIDGAGALPPDRNFPEISGRFWVNSRGNEEIVDAIFSKL